jgi:Domain of unknown function (DUF4249)
MNKYLYIAAVVFCCSSCQKVINIDLNSSSPQYVIEGNIYDHASPYTVKISRSVNYDQDNMFPAVSGAIVVVRDTTAAITDTLTETAPGTYQTNNASLVGTSGHTYSLFVQASGNIFTAVSTMPVRIPMDSMYDTHSLFGRNYSIVPVYKEPITKGNYFHFIEYINDTENKAIYVRNDNLIAGGQTVQLPLQGGGANGKAVQLGDNVLLYMECIDSAMYQYYFTLTQTTNQNSATPSNPQSNIKGGALGYFSAQTSQSRSIVVQ